MFAAAGSSPLWKARERQGRGDWLRRQREAAEDVRRQAAELEERRIEKVRRNRERRETLRRAAIENKRRMGRDIVREVAEEHGLTAIDMRSGSRVRRLAHVRQAAMYRLMVETELSFVQAGMLLGGRDHTTILHGVRAHCRRHGLPLPRGMAR